MHKQLALEASEKGLAENAPKPTLPVGLFPPNSFQSISFNKNLFLLACNVTTAMFGPESFGSA